jgi:hypothetical protein
MLNKRKLPAHLCKPTDRQLLSLLKDRGAYLYWSLDEMMRHLTEARRGHRLHSASATSSASLACETAAVHSRRDRCEVRYG